MTTPTAKLRLQERVIVALLSCRTIKEAAVRSEVCERSILRWMTEKEFKEAYAQAKSELLETAINKLRTAALDAGSRLHAVVLDSNAPAATAVTAAGRVYELLFRGIQVEDLDRRLSELEKKIGKGEPVTLTFADGSVRSISGTTRHWFALNRAMFERVNAQDDGLPIPKDPLSIELDWLAACVEVSEVDGQKFSLTKAILDGPVDCSPIDETGEDCLEV